MGEEEHLPRIIHRRGTIPVLLLLALLPFVYAYVHIEARDFVPFGPELVMAVITSAFMVLFSLVAACVKSSEGTPYKRLIFHRAKLAGILSMLGLAHVLTLPLLVVGPVWQTFHWGSAALVLTVPLLLCVLVGAFMLIHRLFRPYLLDSEGRVVPEAVIKANADTDPHWKWWGYYNPDNPDEIVDRAPYGFGVTPNWAHRGNWVVMGYFGAFILFVMLAALSAILQAGWIGDR
ncbi:MAG: hypothetical protein QG656_1983 [Candidatus Hydrogenedentes bacterium]|nr:hypothetical protein [Candidatus Hydrogenedentota bacterium]